MRLLFATGNPGKLAELRAILAASKLPIHALGLADMPPLDPPIVVVEDGETFEANALKKARAYSAAHGVMTLADDSGLCVDALGGAPGVHSSRFSGGGDAENNTLLLKRLAGVPPEGRGAEFRCVLALVVSGSPDRTVSGACRGSIVERPRGQHGFGYDPLFEVAGLGRTMAELTPAEKNRLSHRARAFGALTPVLQELVGG